MPPGQRLKVPSGALDVQYCPAAHGMQHGASLDSVVTTTALPAKAAELAAHTGVHAGEGDTWNVPLPALHAHSLVLFKIAAVVGQPSPTNEMEVMRLTVKFTCVEAFNTPIVYRRPFRVAPLEENTPAEVTLLIAKVPFKSHAAVLAQELREEPSPQTKALHVPKRAISR